MLEVFQLVRGKTNSWHVNMNPHFNGYGEGRFDYEEWQSRGIIFHDHGAVFHSSTACWSFPNITEVIEITPEEMTNYLYELAGNQYGTPSIRSSCLCTLCAKATAIYLKIPTPRWMQTTSLGDRRVKTITRKQARQNRDNIKLAQAWDNFTEWEQQVRITYDNAEKVKWVRGGRRLQIA
jgi:hypothetical protein